MLGAPLSGGGAEESMAPHCGSAAWQSGRHAQKRRTTGPWGQADGEEKGSALSAQRCVWEAKRAVGGRQYCGLRATWVG